MTLIISRLGISYGNDDRSIVTWRFDLHPVDGRPVVGSEGLLMHIFYLA